MNGMELIALERNRQIAEEGWTPEHDATNFPREWYKNVVVVPLIDAASEYLKAGRAAVLVLPETNDGVGASRLSVPEHWPWHPSWWKPSDDPVRNLVKAGALIAAEIDRLQAQ